MRHSIVFQPAGKGIGQFTGGIDVSAEDVRLCKAAFHARLPGHEDRGDSRILCKPGGGNDSAGIEDYGDLVKSLFHLGDEPFFCCRQVKITPLKDPGGSFE